MKNMLRIAVCGGVLVMLLAACTPQQDTITVEKITTQQPTTVETQPPTVEPTPEASAEEESYPMSDTPVPPATAQAEGYPAPAVPTLTAPPDGYPQPPTRAPFLFPESEAGQATIKGQLILTDPLNAALEGNDSVYLLPVPENQGAVYPEFVAETAIQIVADSVSGEFRFLNVPVGSYAMVAFTTSGRMSVRDFADHKVILLYVAEQDLGTTIDLGRVSVP